jgi:hypothetical protein
MSHDMDALQTRLRQELNHPSVPVPQSLWKHYKGNVYKVDCIGIRESTGELEVCYRPVDDSLGCFWIRPLSEWNQFVSHGDIQVKRFSLVKT